MVGSSRTQSGVVRTTARQITAYTESPKSLKNLRPLTEVDLCLKSADSRLKYLSETKSCYVNWIRLTKRNNLTSPAGRVALRTAVYGWKLDSELYISRVKLQPLTKAFADGRSITAKRYRDAQSMTKPEMIHVMIKRADQSGIHAQYFLAETWFASKSMLTFIEAQSLVSIVRMKKNKTRYCVSGSDKPLASVAELYQHHIKGKWQKVKGRPYQSKAITVELNLAQTLDAPDHWIKVKLLFIRGVNEEKQRA